jgi:hypothetical protein
LKAFSAEVDDFRALFRQKAEWDLLAFMQDHLSAINPQLMWEFGPATKGSGHFLVITSESARHLRPLVGKILERAPQLEGWEFYDYRLDEGLRQAIPTVKARTGVDISDYRVRASLGENHLVDLMYFSDSSSESDLDDAENAAFVASETLLGERCLDRWIGGIAVSPIPKAKGFKGLLVLCHSLIVG